MNDLKVKLLSWTGNPVETVYGSWQSAKTTDPVLSAEEIKQAIEAGKIDKKEVRETFLKVVEAALPVSEFISFSFVFENLPIVLREQWVRERMWSFWLQSARVFNLGNFANDGNHHIPPRYLEKPEMLKKFKETMFYLQKTYNDFIKMGATVEEAREVSPVALAQNGSACCNLRTLQHTFSKRNCMILQGELWNPLLSGMMQELVTKVDPIFAMLAQPPCINKDNFKGCVFNIENEGRISKKDPNVPCPIYVQNVSKEYTIEQWKKDNPVDSVGYKMVQNFEKNWSRDAFTGKVKNG